MMGQGLGGQQIHEDRHTQEADDGTEGDVQDMP